MTASQNRQARTMSRIHVEWIDSVSGSGWERPNDAIKDAEHPNAMTISTVGWLLDERDDWILVVGSYMESGASVLAPIQIPKVAILTRRSWRPA